MWQLPAECSAPGTCSVVRNAQVAAVAAAASKKAATVQGRRCSAPPASTARCHCLTCCRVPGAAADAGAGGGCGRGQLPRRAIRALSALRASILVQSGVPMGCRSLSARPCWQTAWRGRTWPQKLPTDSPSRLQVLLRHISRRPGIVRHSSKALRLQAQPLRPWPCPLPLGQQPIERSDP